MEIVRLQKEHCEILAELEKLCFSRPWSQKAIEDEVNNPNAFFVTAVDEEKILGYGGMHCTHQECYIDNIAVFGHQRKKGVGTAIVKALVDNGFDGYVRPDHGRMIWGETGRAGYGLYDRALGACYINGLFEAAEKEKAAGKN